MAEKLIDFKVLAQLTRVQMDAAALGMTTKKSNNRYSGPRLRSARVL